MFVLNTWLPPLLLSSSPMNQPLSVIRMVNIPVNFFFIQLQLHVYMYVPTKVLIDVSPHDY